MSVFPDLPAPNLNRWFRDLPDVCNDLIEGRQVILPWLLIINMDTISFFALCWLSPHLLRGQQINLLCYNGSYGRQHQIFNTAFNSISFLNK